MLDLTTDFTSLYFTNDFQWMDFQVDLHVPLIIDKKKLSKYFLS